MTATAAERYTGASVKRSEDPRILTGAGRYVDDIKLPGMLHAAFVRSPMAPARVLSVDVSAARAMPGWRLPAFPTCRSGPPPPRICWPGRGRRRSCSMRQPAVRPKISTRRPTFTGRRTTGRRSRPPWCAAACEQLRTVPITGPARGSD